MEPPIININIKYSIAFLSYYNIFSDFLQLLLTLSLILINLLTALWVNIKIMTILIRFKYNCSLYYVIPLWCIWYWNLLHQNLTNRAHHLYLSFHRSRQWGSRKPYPPHIALIFTDENEHLAEIFDGSLKVNGKWDLVLLIITGILWNLIRNVVVEFC